MKSEQEVIDLLKANPEAGVCRLCLMENDGNFESLDSSQGANTYSDKLKIILIEDFSEVNSLPLYLCNTCSVNLILVDELLSKWRETQKILMKYCFTTKDASDNCYDEDVKKVDIKSDLKMEEDWSHPMQHEDIFNAVMFHEDDHLGEDASDLSETRQRKKRKQKGSRRQKVRLKRGEELKEEKEDILESDVQPESGQVVCKVCGKPLKSQESLGKHMEKMHSEARYRKVGKVSGYGALRRYHCTFCDYAAKNTRMLNGHIRIHTGEKPYVCDVCQRHFSTHSGLYQHKFTHSDVMNFTCAHCGKQFNSKRKHERHQLVHQDKNFICDICKKPLKSKPTLVSHIQRHSNVRNYSCETCGAAFFTSSELIYHSKIHLTSKRFHCNLCKFSTNTKAHLDVHLQRHSGFRPFECSICPLRCYTKGLLKVHMRTHTKEKIYPCSTCSKVFAHSSTLNRHMLRSHAIKYKWNDQVDRRIVK